MIILRHKKDKEIEMHCYLIKYQDLLYFIHSVKIIPELNDDEFELHISENAEILEILAIEDFSSINNSNHILFESESVLITQLLNIESHDFCEVFFLYSMSEFLSTELIKWYQKLFGSMFTELILNKKEVIGVDLKKDFIYYENNGCEFYTFSNLKEGTIHEMVTYGYCLSYRSNLFNTKVMGLITNDFLFRNLTSDEFAQKVCMYYRKEQSENPISIQKKVKIAERKWKIEVLLNPNFLIKKT